MTAINFSNEAIQRLTEVVRGNPNAAGLRLQITGRMQGEFKHVLSVVEKGKEVEDDIKVSASGLPVPVFVEGRNAAYLDGVKITTSTKARIEAAWSTATPIPSGLGRPS